MVITKHKAHQYMKVKLSNSTVYRCMLPGCSHYVRPQFILNRIGLCWYCGEEFLINRDLARRKRVHCSNCTAGKETKVKNEELVSFLEDIKSVANDE